MLITSVNNDKIKYVNKLKNNKFMNEEKKFIVEGKHLVLEAFKNGLLLETISINDENYGVINTKVTSEVMRKISDLPSFSPVIGICKFKDEDYKLGKRIIILDNVQDPGNIGTIIRSSNAFNFDNVILGIGCPNIYSSKVIRASQGMIFNTNVLNKDLKYFIPYLINNGYLVYGTNVNCGIDVSDVNKNCNIAIVMGNEGAGISDEISSLINSNLYIKMNPSCESLNVAVASSIIMYEINK